MERQIVVLLCLSVWGVTGSVDHAELRGEHSSQDDIDNGQCVPVRCELGVPPPECHQLCASRKYETICQPPGDFCLCRHMVHGKPKLVSPDEVEDQPPDSSEVNDAEKSKASNQEPSSDQHLEPSKQDQSSENSEDDAEGGTISFQIFAVLLPIKQFLYESLNEANPKPEPTADSVTLEYQTVNVHEGRLFWDFRYILTGLLLLMIGLVVYELVLCATQVYGSKPNLTVQCEKPEVKVIPVFPQSEKILKV